jgi:alcohol dehydrogenase (cytochrome c)
MNRFVLATALALLAAAPALSQSLDDLKNDGNGKNTSNVLTYGMGYGQNRYSPIKQINKQTVKRLVPVWNVSLNSSYGEQAQPLVYDGVLYATDAEATVAVDITTGKLSAQAIDDTGAVKDSFEKVVP